MAISLAGRAPTAPVLTLALLALVTLPACRVRQAAHAPGAHPPLAQPIGPPVDFRSARPPRFSVFLSRA